MNTTEGDQKKRANPTTSSHMLMIRAAVKTPAGVIHSKKMLDDKDFLTSEPQADFKCYELGPGNIVQAFKACHTTHNKETVQEQLDSLLSSEEETRGLPGCDNQTLRVWILDSEWSTLLVKNQGSGPILFRQKSGDHRCRALWPGYGMVFEPDHAVFYLFTHRNYNPATPFDADHFAVVRFAWTGTHGSYETLTQADAHFLSESFPLEEDTRKNLAVLPSSQDTDPGAPQPFRFDLVKTARGFPMKEETEDSVKQLHKLRKLLPVLCIQPTTGLVMIAYHKNTFTSQGTEEGTTCPKWNYAKLTQAFSDDILALMLAMIKEAENTPWGSVQKTIPLPPLRDFNSAVELFAERLHSEEAGEVKVYMGTRKFDHCVHIASYATNGHSKLHFVLQPYAIPQGREAVFGIREPVLQAPIMELPGVLLTLTKVDGQEMCDPIKTALRYDPSKGVHTAANILEKPTMSDSHNNKRHKGGAATPNTKTSSSPDGRSIDWDTSPSQTDGAEGAGQHPKTGSADDGDKALKSEYDEPLAPLCDLRGLHQYADSNIAHRQLIL